MALAAALPQTVLTSLDLRSNGLGADATRALTAALPRTALETLRLEGNAEAELEALRLEGNAEATDGP